MITVYGADWCEDTRRSLRHLRRLAVLCEYRNVDEDLDALDTAKRLNGGRRRTPTIDLGVGGPPLVEPDNDTLTGALVELEMLSDEDAHERLAVQNVGDFERVLRTSAGLVLLVAGRVAHAARAGRSVFWARRWRFGGVRMVSRVPPGRGHVARRSW
jgi:mycoredoxin